jgi:DNA-binding YbaB/EbfC family protein
MFKALGNIASIMKQASAMKGKMAELQEKLGRVRVEGTAGGGMVTVEVSGHQKVLAVRVADSLLNPGDREMLEDLLAAATNQALEKSREAAAREMSELTGGLDIPGLDDALKGLNPGGGTGP